MPVQLICRFWAVFFIYLPTALSGQPADVSPWQWKGYVKDLQQWVFSNEPNSLLNGGFFHNRLTLKYAPDSSAWSFDLELRNRLFYGDLVRIQPGFARGLDQDDGLLDLAFVPVRRPALAGSVNIDRLWAQWNKNRWTLRLGRQRIHWGMAITWNPNDWFNAWNFLDFDYEERPGADALRVQFQAGGFSQFDLAVGPARHVRNAVCALRYGGHAGRYDWQALAGVYRNRLAAGLGFAGDIGQTGLKGELSMFQPIDSTAGAPSISATLEVNTLLGSAWFCNGAVLINSNGLANSADLLRLTQTNLGADNLMPGKVSLLASVSHAFTPLFQAAFSAVYSPNGQLIVLVPTAAWSVAENWDLDLTGQLFWLEHAGGKIENAANIIYLRTRWSF